MKYYTSRNNYSHRWQQSKEEIISNNIYPHRKEQNYYRYKLRLQRSSLHSWVSWYRSCCQNIRTARMTRDVQSVWEPCIKCGWYSSSRPDPTTPRASKQIPVAVPYNHHNKHSTNDANLFSRYQYVCIFERIAALVLKASLKLRLLPMK